MEVSYTYEANGRLHVAARLLGQDAGVSTDFVRANSLPDEDLELWGRYVAEELAAEPPGRAAPAGLAPGPHTAAGGALAACSTASE